MNYQTKVRITAAIVGVLSVFALSSCNDINEEVAPVELIATFDSSILVADLGDPECGDGGLGLLNLTSVIKQEDPSRDEFLDVRLSTMRISYARNDGGTVVPKSFVQSISGLISAGSSGEVSGFIVFQPSAFTEAPFAALLPVNGGRDPETGNSSVGLEIIIEVWGETLSGERVSTSTRFPLTICIGCGCVEV